MPGVRMSEAEVARHQARVSGKPVPAAKKPKRKGLRSKLEEDIAAQLERLDLPPFVTDYRFHSTRQWAFDIAWPDQRFAIEVDGTLAPGKMTDHQSTAGMTNDYQKTAEAMLWGWKVLRVTSPMVKSGEAADYALRLMTRIETERAAR